MCDGPGGQWRLARTDWPAAAAERASALDPPPARRYLLAPSSNVWMRGEGLRSSESAFQILKRRELKIGGEGCDIALPGEADAFGQTMQEYVPLLFLAIETTRLATLRRLAFSRPHHTPLSSRVLRCFVHAQTARTGGRCERILSRTATDGCCSGTGIDRHDAHPR